MIKSTVLLVEDDANIRDMYTTAFTEAGLDVSIATTGTEAITTALAERPDAILMDIILPDMSGHDAVAKIRLHEWGKTAKIIYLTNLTGAEHVVQAVEHKTEKYIIKANTTPKEVVNQVRMVMHS